MTSKGIHRMFCLSSIDGLGGYLPTTNEVERKVSFESSLEYISEEDFQLDTFTVFIIGLIIIYAIIVEIKK